MLQGEQHQTNETNTAPDWTPHEENDTLSPEISGEGPVSSGNVSPHTDETYVHSESVREEDPHTPGEFLLLFLLLSNYRSTGRLGFAYGLRISKCYTVISISVIASSVHGAIAIVFSVLHYISGCALYRPSIGKQTIWVGIRKHAAPYTLMYNSTSWFMSQSCMK